jgi:putative ABC transport system permease protein
MTEAFTSTMAFYVGFAGAIAFGVAYTAGRIALSERARDLAALQVLGFSHFEIAYIILGELMVLALIAAPAGLWVGDLLARGVAAAFAREDLRLPYGVSPRAFGVSLTAYGLITAVSLSLIGRRLAGLDLVAVLKTRE